MALVGADVDQLEALAKRLETASHKLAETSGSSTVAIMVAAWTGADIDSLRSQWNRQVKPGLATSQAALTKLALALKRNAQEQRSTSAADTGHSTSSSTGQSADELYNEALKDPSSLSKLSADEVASMWSKLSDAQKDELISKDHRIIGNLDGVPFADRITANQLTAREEFDKPGTSAEERAYLKTVFEPAPGDTRIQLVTFDPENHRIVEMIGTPGPDTRHVVTYVPGTFSNEGSFYNGSVQEVGHYLQDNHPDTVVMVFKDGAFPGSEDQSGLLMAKGVSQANDADLAKPLGERLTSFEADVARESYLGNAESTAIGHSWGLTDITSSETNGTHYNQVISLSGAWMPKDWSPQAGTSYSDYSYYDILQEAQKFGVVGDGNNPRSSDAFSHGAYYQGESVFSQGPLGIPYVDQSHLLNNHSLIASDQSANMKALDDIESRIYG